MKNHQKPLFVLLIVAVMSANLFNSCRKECYDCKEVTTKNISIPDKITGVIIEGPWEVSITQDSTNNDALLEYCTRFENKFTAKVLPNGYLHIKMTSWDWNFHNNDVLRATITAVSLEKIEASGAAGIRTYGHFSTLENITLSGASMVNGLSSAGISAKIEMSGASTLKGFIFTGTGIDAELSGASKVTMDNVTLEYCTVDCSGASTFNCKGYAGETTFKGSGASDYKTLGLESENLSIDLSGASQADVLVNNKITGTLTGASTLRYKGATDVNGVSVTGGSHIIKLD